MKTTHWTDSRYTIDRGIGSRAHIGMVVISNDQTLSSEARSLLNVDGVALYESRAPASRQRNEAFSSANLKGMFDHVDAALPLINSVRPPDVVALGCTSSSMLHGPDALQRRVQQVFPNANVTDPYTAILAALEALQADRVGFLSPYPRVIAQQMIDAIQTAGHRVTNAATFHEVDGFVDDDAPFITPDSIATAVCDLVSMADLDTVVVACTQMRASGLVEALEKRTGVSITTSNHALCWHALRLAGVTEAIDGRGRLYREPLPLLREL